MSTHKIKTPRERLDLIKVVEKLKPDKTWVIKINEYQKLKTYPQLKLLFLWYGCIAFETGNTVVAIDEYFKDKFGPKHTTSIFGEMRTLPISKAKYTKEQMRHYLNAIDTDVSTEGIRLLYPDDMHWESLEEKYKEYIG